MIIKRTVILLSFLTTLLSLSNAQEVEVTAAFDSSRIYIGDQINYTVTVTQPSDVRLNIQQLKDTLCRNIEIISGPVTDSISMQDNMLKTVNRYLVTSFDSGFYEAPPVYAELKSETGILRFYSEYSPLEVMRVNITPPDSAEIFDIIEPYGAPVTLGEILPWILLAIIIAVVVWGSVKIIRKYWKIKEEPEVIVNPDPAHVIAFRDLEKLREEQLWQKGEVKLYYSRLTEILRQYLENRYGVYSMEMTTTETLRALLKTDFKKNGLYTSLKTILEGSDLVKFAKYKPDPVENDVHFQNSWEFVEATMEKEEVIDTEKSDETKNQV